MGGAASARKPVVEECVSTGSEVNNLSSFERKLLLARETDKISDNAPKEEKVDVVYDNNACRSNSTKEEESSNNNSDNITTPRTNISENGLEAMLMTQMSFEMENDDLLFNMLYFSEGNSSSMVDTLREETLAAHSPNNTPYKLTPASETATSKLKVEHFKSAKDFGEFIDKYDPECSICKIEFEEDCSIIRLPTCVHIFHRDCLLRWFQLVRVTYKTK